MRRTVGIIGTSLPVPHIAIVGNSDNSADAVRFDRAQGVPCIRRHFSDVKNGWPCLRGLLAWPLSNDSWFLRAPFEFSERATGEAAEFGRGGVELLRLIGSARLKCGEPAAEARELIRRQLGDGLGDFFDFHGTQYSPCSSQGKGLALPAVFAKLARRQAETG